MYMTLTVASRYVLSIFDMGVLQTFFGLTTDETSEAEKHANQGNTSVREETLYETQS